MVQIIKGQLKYTFHTGQQNYSVDLAGVQVDDGLWHQVRVCQFSFTRFVLLLSCELGTCAFLQSLKFSLLI